MDLADQMAQLAHGLSWADIPASVQERARDRLLDALSTAAGAASLSMPVRQAARAAMPSTGSGPATVVGETGGSASEAAAFVNAVGAHSLLYEDVCLASSDHPGPVICAAALAAAEERDVSLERLLVAIVAGYNTQLILGEIGAEPAIARGFRTTSVFGVVGAAAAAATVFGLDLAQYTSALGLAANGAGGLMEAWAHGTWEPYLHAGFAASAGIVCARLAEVGTVAAPTSFNGRSGYLKAYMGPEVAAPEELRQTWPILEVSCKPYPISGAKTTTVDSALALVETVRAQPGGYDPSTITRIVASMPLGAIAPAGCDRVAPFANATQAQDSAPFCVAAALAGKDMSDLATFFGEYADPLVADLTHRIELVGDPERALGRLEVHVADGTVHEAEVDARQNQVPSTDSMGRKVGILGRELWEREAIDRIVAVVTGPTDIASSTISDALREVRT
ncbi:MAG: MmgE/PrpD family protein [Nocardioides sp.]